ncbi:hypothetical protein [Nostoc sp.]|uniref:hypothetical protein n=1 Tax=Nostoc sp. TaxID=1180 RepID=UPI002FF49A53
MSNRSFALINSVSVLVESILHWVGVETRLIASVQEFGEALILTPQRYKGWGWGLGLY